MEDEICAPQRQQEIVEEDGSDSEFQGDREIQVKLGQ